MTKWKRMESAPNTIYAIGKGFDGGWLIGTNKGLWRMESADGDCTPIAEPLKDVAVTAVAYSKRALFVGAADGLAMSVDGGEIWMQANLARQAPIVQFVLPEFFDQAGLGYCVTLDNGFYRTVDLGRSWNTCNFGMVDKEAIALALSPEFTADAVMIAAVSTGVYKSNNAGSAWLQVKIEPEAMPMSCLAFGKGVVVAGSETHGLYFSIDKGETWFKRNSFSGGAIQALATSPNGERIAVATAQGMATSVDLGESWTRAEGKTPKGIIAMAMDDDGRVLAGTQQDGLWVY